MCVFTYLGSNDGLDVVGKREGSFVGMDVVGIALGTYDGRFVGSDIEALCREAGLIALREDMQASLASQRHFVAAREKVHATMTPQAQEYYEKLEASLKTDQKMRKERVSGFV